MVEAGSVMSCRTAGPDLMEVPMAMAEPGPMAGRSAKDQYFSITFTHRAMELTSTLL
jgi:hypothetical protein